MDDRATGRAARPAATGRRGLLAVLAAVGLAAGEAPAPAGAEVTTPEGICRIPNSPCGRNRQCCAGRCNSGACGCLANGARCSVSVLCCTGRCRQGKCRS